MISRGTMEQGGRRRVFKPAHEDPGEMLFFNYILLPYGEFYKKTRVFLDAKAGDTMRFFNGPEVTIRTVIIVEGVACDALSMMRYGVTWDKAFSRWLSYARMEGHGKDILVKNKCILVIYDRVDV